MDGVGSESSNAKKILVVLLWIAAIYHIILGLIGIFLKNMVVFLAEKFFNFNLTLDDQVIWILNPWAAYFLAVGVMLIFMARDPVKHNNMVYVIAGLFGLRVLQRIWFQLAGDSALQLGNPVLIWIDIIIVAVYAVVLVVLAKKVKA